MYVSTCSELFLDVSSWQIMVSRATGDPCFWENARFLFDLENYGYSFKCLIGWQRDDNDHVEERYYPILRYMDKERSLIELQLCGTPYPMTLGKWIS